MMRNPEPVDERESRLPRWAQQKIARLRSGVHDAEQQLAGVDRSKAVMVRDPYDDYPTPVAVEHQTVRVLVDPEHRLWIDFRLLTDDVTGPVVEVMSSDRISVMPRASNVLEVRVERL